MFQCFLKYHSKMFRGGGGVDPPGHIELSSNGGFIGVQIFKHYSNNIHTNFSRFRMCMHME